MKILFYTRHYSYLRNFDSAIRLLAARGHRIHLAADRPEPLGGETVVRNLAGDYPNVTFGWTPGRERSLWLELATKIRLGIDALRYMKPPYDETPQLVERAWSRTPRPLLRVLDSRWGRSRRGQRIMRVLLRAAERAVPRSAALDRYVREQAPDVALLTPLVDLASPQLDHFHSARAAGVRTCLTVGSWDHLSSKSLIRDLPDRITVWNDVQRREAIDMHGVPDARIVVTGAQCYDQWFTWRPGVPREEFCRRAGLAPDRPYILYICSALFRGSLPEAPFVIEWLRRLRACGDPQLRRAGVLIRPHPARIKQWRNLDSSIFDNVTLLGTNPVDVETKTEYFDSMFYSAAVVGLNTSAMIEAAIVNRPVLTILLPEFRGNQEGTLHFRYLLDAQRGLLFSARTLDEHVEQLAGVLGDPAEASRRNGRFVSSFVRPHGVDVAATPKIVDAIEALAEMPPPAPVRTPSWAYALRVFLYPALAILGVRRLWDEGREELKPLRKQLRGTWRSTVKRSRKAGRSVLARGRKAALGAGKS